MKIEEIKLVILLTYKDKLYRITDYHDLRGPYIVELKESDHQKFRKANPVIRKKLEDWYEKRRWEKK